MEKVALFGVYDHVTGSCESIGCYSGSSQAGRVLVAMYAYSPNPAVSKRLADYDLVQISEPFDPMLGSDPIKHVFVDYGSLEGIKRAFDNRDGIFTIPSEEDM